MDEGYAEELYVVATRLQALRDIVRIADVGLDPTLKQIVKLATEGVDRLEERWEKLREKFLK